MGEAPAAPEPSPEYQLHHDLDGSSFAIRENLVDIIERELLGPRGGPEEVLPFSPRTQYLVGHIAPVELEAVAVTAVSDEEGREQADVVEALGDGQGPAPGRGVPAGAADDAATGDDEDEDTIPKRGLITPSSMGLRFQIPTDLETFTVITTWGTYEAVETDQVSKAGKPIKNYRRTPVEVTRTIRVDDLVSGQTVTVPLQESICLRIDRFDDPGFDRHLVEIALCNDRKAPAPIPMGMWAFQTKLVIHADGNEVFLPVRDVMEHDWPTDDTEVRQLELQYRNRLEFAIGRTCSVDWVVRDGARRATEVSTTWLPVAEVPQTRPRLLGEVMLAMDRLATASADELQSGIEPLIAGYAEWLADQKTQAEALPEHLRETAEAAIWDATVAQKRLAAGLEHLTSDTEALRCFQFMNRVMRDQRIHSQIAAERASNPSLSIADARALVEARGEVAASWYPFQLAFILMQLPALTDPTAAIRSVDNSSRVELLFFPTGGGKTEAYLGLAAYVFAIRRRQGIVESTEGPLDGGDGVAVLMRYTLRLLTAQQFQRATTLICAAELNRQEDPATWGTTPFRIGLWVGTAVSPKRYDEAKKQLLDAHEHGNRSLTVLQVQRCPWCGTGISSKDVVADDVTRRILVHCGDDLARCPFSKGGQVNEGLPILTVDEEVYRLTPSFVIATVDKFARLAREGEAASLFGYVARRCERHGYVHPDSEACTVKDRHPAAGAHPAAQVRPTTRLRPPDLIIQDELHLITGALGTAVGLFEVAIETLASWQTDGEKQVRPMIVASTATVRNASDQVQALYGRGVRIFPPQVLDVADTYFSSEVPIDRDHPGRRYIGISAQGERMSSTETRVTEILLSGGQLLFNRAAQGVGSGKGAQTADAADPYMTLVAYFNSRRELAGMSRYIGDDVTTRVRSPHPATGFPRRYGTGIPSLNVGELTARIASAKIGKTLDNLAVRFDAEFDTTEAVRARARARAENKTVARRADAPFDVVLATSMLQVGVDVQRLGLMLVVGQPKNTAEYIQASSRVGRDASRPGLVVTLGNWARPRDRAHFEQFRHYHATFYAQVEALSVTPFSPTSLERGIDGLLVSAVRVTQATIEDGLSPERSAGKIDAQHDAVLAIIERLKERIALAAHRDKNTGSAPNLLINLLDRWSKRVKTAAQYQQGLVYERIGTQNKYMALMTSPENVEAGAAPGSHAPFVIANSMREVQPEINILVSPLPDRMFAKTPDHVSDWELPAGDPS